MLLSAIMIIVGIILFVGIIVGFFYVIKALIHYNSTLKKSKTYSKEELDKMKIKDL